MTYESEMSRPAFQHPILPYPSARMTPAKHPLAIALASVAATFTLGFGALQYVSPKVHEVEQQLAPVARLFESTAENKNEVTNWNNLSYQDHAVGTLACVAREYAQMNDCTVAYRVKRTFSEENNPRTRADAYDLKSSTSQVVCWIPLGEALPLTSDLERALWDECQARQ